MKYSISHSNALVLKTSFLKGLLHRQSALAFSLSLSSLHFWISSPLLIQITLPVLTLPVL